MLRNVASSIFLVGCLLAVLFPDHVGRAAVQQGADSLIKEFEKSGEFNERYESIRVLELNKEHCVLAFWYEEGSYLQLSVDVFRSAGERGKHSFRRIFSGDVSEEVTDIATFDLTADGRDELLFVSNSGMIKMIRVLEDLAAEMRLIFSNGGNEVTLLKVSREILIKSRSTRELDVYRWNSVKNEFVLVRTEAVLF